MKSTRIFKLSEAQRIWQQVFTVSFTLALLTASAAAEASDLQIYAKPTAGKKTIIMMLDTSGSMGSGSIVEDYGASGGFSSCSTSSDTGGSGSYTYSRTYCSFSYSTSASSTYQKLKDLCYNPNKNADGTSNGGTGALKCYDRIARLKDGVFAFLDSSNASLNDVIVGVGHFSSYTTTSSTTGDNSSGEILLAARTLGAVGSTQRNAIKSIVKGLAASNGTPTAHAYAEAAAYLMGTSTYSETYNYRNVAVDKYRFVRQYSTVRSGSFGNYRYTYTYTYTLASCIAWSSTNFSTNTQSCSTWGSATTTGPVTDSTLLTSSSNPQWTGQPSLPAYDSFTSSGSNPQTYILQTTQSQLYQVVADANSGMPKSKSRDTTSNPDIVMDRTASDLNALYKSPLPAVADRVSCDGQGVYILSDGAANNTSDSEATAVMSKSLGGYGSGFSCTGGLADATDPSSGSPGAWNCMGEYAKKLFDKTKNPTGVSIQTAFVGFGSAMSSLTQGYVQRACQLTSRTQSSRSSDDSCSPNQGTYAVASPGYGNGGFFTTQSASGVTDSVVAFINNLGARALSPLPTGAPSIPVDALNPSGFQPYGYLRMLEPNPSNSLLIWRGNLKKYNVFQGALTDVSSTQVFNSLGEFATTTKDIWNNSSYNDGGIINLGGAYSRVPMPASGRTAAAADLTANPPKYIVPATPTALRAVFTDVASSDGTTLTPITSPTTGVGVSLLQTPAFTSSTTTDGTYVLGKFQPTTGQTVLKDFPLLAKLKLLNYLGYSVDLASTALPASLATPVEPFLSMGGIIHSFPVQMTYSGQLKNDELDNANKQSVLYGTMEGGVHLVDSSTGVEQMVFVPEEILDSTASKALRKSETDTIAPTHGVDAPWVADPAYNIGSTTQDGNGDYITPVTAKQMNVYGGLRMGGSSYYALDVLTPTAPKLLFRINASTSGFSRMGQTWSKPVLANIRYNGAIKRVMIVGGGYDACYENPRFRLGASVSSTDYPDTSCNNKTEAQGDAVYIVDAKTGALIWSAAYSASATDGKQYMKHSIVSRISTLDRDADGLVDHLYFGDLGGQVFRADLNNASQRTSGQTSQFGVRVVRLANLATSSSGTAITNGDNPRFYEAPTVTIHDQGTDTFILVGIASGDRSTPLDVSPSIGRENMLPSTALTGRPVNNVYGILDRDFINKDLISTTTTLSYSSLKSKDFTLASLQKNPQTLTSVVAAFFPYTAGTSKEGWYRSLSSSSDGTEKSGSLRTAGGLKAFEEPVALTGNLLVPVYDPEGTGVAVGDPCLPRVVGESDRQQYCLPYGACLNTDGTKNTTLEAKTGFRLVSNSNDPGAVIGSGIRGISLGPKLPATSTDANSCGNLTLVGNTGGTGAWSCTKKLLSTRWYEKYLR